MEAQFISRSLNAACAMGFEARSALSVGLEAAVLIPPTPGAKILTFRGQRYNDWVRIRLSVTVYLSPYDNKVGGGAATFMPGIQGS